MVIDGITHSISDLGGVGQGFRYTNVWLATLTRNILPPGFYVGNELGSFNSWMRLTTGLLAGLAVTWMAHPLFDATFQDMRRTLGQREAHRANELVDGE